MCMVPVQWDSGFVYVLYLYLPPNAKVCVLVARSAYWHDMRIARFALALRWLFWRELGKWSKKAKICQFRNLQDWISLVNSLRTVQGVLWIEDDEMRWWCVSYRWMYMPQSILFYSTRLRYHSSTDSFILHFILLPVQTKPGIASIVACNFTELIIHYTLVNKQKQ